ncbi:MAG: TetR/AcrR family transcriptional regulator [Gemmatimonadales bacterium]
MSKGVRGRKRLAARARPAAEPARQPQQERGERRVEEILDAAARVIAEVGVEGATTNAIAERAGASMGSLYHFFPHKDAIVRALAARYDGELRQLNRSSMTGEAARVSVAAMVDGIVTPLARFMERNPAYMPVYYAVRDPLHPGCMTAELTDTIVGLVEQLMAARTPGGEPTLRRRQAGVAVELVHRMLEYAWNAPPAERGGIVLELKRLLALYSTMISTGQDPLATGH